MTTKLDALANALNALQATEKQISIRIEELSEQKTRFCAEHGGDSLFSESIDTPYDRDFSYNIAVRRKLIAAIDEIDAILNNPEKFDPNHDPIWF